jgi:ubiquitin-hydrolase Zn-finger-containing protein
MTCEHVAQIPDPMPEVPERTSPHRHATVHYYGTDHPVMRSAEPGEAWRWCYNDHQLV